VSIVETLGGPDVAHVFLHDVTSFTAFEGFGYRDTRVARWAERALVMARPHDVVCVLDPVDAAFLRHLSALGVGPRPRHVVTVEGSGPRATGPLAAQLLDDARAFETVCGLVAQARQVIVNPFVTTLADVRLVAALGTALDRPVSVLGGTPDTVARVNRKDYIRARAMSLGVPVAAGDVVELPTGSDGRPADLSRLREALARRVRLTGRALVRGARGASGSATFVVDASPGRIEAVLGDIAARADNTVYLVDVMHEVTVSPNVLMHVEPRGGPISWVGASDQRLDAALVHRGNLYPSRARALAGMVESAHRLARWLRDEGVVGLVGFDFCEYRNPDTGTDDYFLAEANARINGAVYPTFLMESINREQARCGRPPVRAFLSVQTLTTRAGAFEEFTGLHRPALFEPSTGRGCVPFNTGQLADRRCSGAFFGRTAAEVVAMYEAWGTAGS
jgi:hypothetical protein